MKIISIKKITMKKISVFFLALVALTGSAVKAQTVDEIVAKNIEAMGGIEKLSSLKTVKMSGSMNAQGYDITMTITKSHLKGMRLDLELMGNSYYQVANATKGQVFMPGMPEATEMDPDSYKALSSQMDLQGALVNYKDKGNNIELVGSEKVDGADAYNLKVTLKTGLVMNYFIDKKTNRLIKTSGKREVQGQEMTIESTLSDYKQNTDGYWFPYSITTMQGTITYDKIETNVPVDEKIFGN